LLDVLEAILIIVKIIANNSFIMYTKLKERRFIMNRIAQKLLSARKQLGFSSEYVANLIDIKIYELKAFEQNLSELPFDVIKKLCNLYGLSQEVLTENSNSYYETVYARTANTSDTLSDRDKQIILELQRIQRN
jgi:transcriptional regulator with XRE-family HTH domain